MGVKHYANSLYQLDRVLIHVKMTTKTAFQRHMIEKWRTSPWGDWRSRPRDEDVNKLIIRSLDDGPALLIANSSNILCDDNTLASLAVETYRLLNPIGTDLGAVVVFAGDSEVAALYRDTPIDSKGAPRYKEWLEVGNWLDDFAFQIKEVLQGRTFSVWQHGSNLEGFPDVRDPLLMVREGYRSRSLIQLFKKLPLNDEVAQTLTALTTEEDHVALAALSALETHGAAINLERVVQIARDVGNTGLAAHAARMLAKAAAEEERALDFLFALASDGAWRDAVGLLWLTPEVQTREDLRLSVRRRFRRRIR